MNKGVIDRFNVVLFLLVVDLGRKQVEHILKDTHYLYYNIVEDMREKESEGMFVR